MGMLLLLLLQLDLTSNLEIASVVLKLAHVSSCTGGLHDSSHI